MNKIKLISLLLEKKICKEEDIQGCSIAEIEHLEKSAGLQLPGQYKEFLLAVGKGAGSFFQGSDIFFPLMNGLNKEAIELLEENDEEFDLPENAFVFLMHQGYEFDYFDTSNGNDPPVYQYVEGNGPPVLTWGSFSKFLNDSIMQHAKACSC
ncbi:SMI1/KNR4 family protein [Saezia sanguinis]|uniref:SMI1/KNR4 family protein n=1 Tax=Saezia sanguinis TaxID=1965230 RepID=UPI0030653106